MHVNTPGARTRAPAAEAGTDDGEGETVFVAVVVLILVEGDVLSEAVTVLTGMTGGRVEISLAVVTRMAVVDVLAIGVLDGVDNTVSFG